MFSSQSLLSETWKSLAGRWIPLLCTFWIAVFCQSIPSAIPKVGTLISVVLSGTFYVGMSAYALGFLRKGESDWESMIQGFENPVREILAFLMFMGIVLLGIVLCIIPGIIWMLSYSQTFFILADHPEISASQALRQSRKIMYGHRMDLVKLHVWQSGLILLSSLTLFIALIWLFPYFIICWARFYEDIKDPAGDVPA